MKVYEGICRYMQVYGGIPSLSPLPLLYIYIYIFVPCSGSEMALILSYDDVNLALHTMFASSWFWVMSQLFTLLAE